MSPAPRKTAAKKTASKKAAKKRTTKKAAKKTALRFATPKNLDPTLKDLPPALQSYFHNLNWTPFPFQLDTWAAYLSGKSGLLHAPTGYGKTLAVWLGPVIDTLNRLEDPTHKPRGCEVLWLTPLRALAADTLASLRAPVADLGWSIEARTGDSSAYQKAKLRKQLPYCLVTTPESLSLMLTHPETREQLVDLKTVIIDEWHELLGSKRGTQTELCLARLRRWLPELRTWVLSATLGNLQDAARPAMGPSPHEIISADLKKEIKIETLIPDEIEKFPWAGHLGLKLLRKVCQQVERAKTTLIFANTRSQTEIWFQEITNSLPKLADFIAIHHGSLDRERRSEVEQGLKDGTLRAVVCTSSLDLGVDFSPVEQVIQIGSPKGVARLAQRAGRAGHSPGQVSKILCVPTNALELIEFAATRDAWAVRDVESRYPLSKPLDVLVQHLVTLVLGEPATPESLHQEILTAPSYQKLSEEEWTWAIEFITNGGALSAYPQYQKAVFQDDGTIAVLQKKTAQLHRMSIGTITSDSIVAVKFSGGKLLGTVEEGFITKFKQGQQFIFAGRRLELVRFRNKAATVKVAAKPKKGVIAHWGGTRMPLSTELSRAVAKRMILPRDTPEMEAVGPILDLQAQRSSLPGLDHLLVEWTRTREGEHLFIYTFAGRLVNEGLGALTAFRLARGTDQAVSVAQNDYGFTVSADQQLPLDEDILRDALSLDDLVEDLVECLNTSEMAKRQFREIARVAGLIVQDLPGRKPNTKNLQVSANLLYEVFERYDPQNLLLEQSKREILERQLELTRLQTTLEEIATRPFVLRETEKLTPMAFPLWADRLTATHTSDNAKSRLEKMLLELEATS